MFTRGYCPSSPELPRRGGCGGGGRSHSGGHRGGGAGGPGRAMDFWGHQLEDPRNIFLEYP